MLVLVSPAVRFNLRAPLCSEVSATDASDDWEAEVSQTFPSRFVEELARNSFRKPVWTKLLRPTEALARVRGASGELPNGETFDYHPVWQVLFRCVKFREVRRRRIWRARHINVHELRTMLASERRRGFLEPSSRLITGSDSQVSLGAALKGRSSSPRLNGLLRQSIPDYWLTTLLDIQQYGKPVRRPLLQWKGSWLSLPFLAFCFAPRSAWAGRELVQPGSAFLQPVGQWLLSQNTGHCEFEGSLGMHLHFHPLRHAFEHPREPPPLRSTIMATRLNKLELFKTLARTGRLGALETTEIRPGISSGLFAVMKDLVKDQLILDGRGPNVFEIPLNRWTRALLLLLRRSLASSCFRTRSCVQ